MKADANGEESRMSDVSPCEPRSCLSDLPGIGGHIGDQPEHFVVDEIPLYPASGQGQHLYVRVRKRSMTTPQLVKILSRASGVRDRDIGYAGLKDKHAITSQWFSFCNVEDSAPAAWELPESVQVIEQARHDNKLRTGHLFGNRFQITVVDAAAANGGSLEASVERLLQAVQERGLPNYFGRQRFGREREGLAEALQWLRSGARAKDRFLAKLYPSVIQAEVFNRYLNARLDLGLDRVLPGEVVRLEGSGKMFLVEDAERETPRWLERDIHLTGPITGPKMKPAAAEAAELERRACESLGLDEELLQRLGRVVPGTRRDLLVQASDCRCHVDGAQVVFEFTLPSGAYATQWVGEFTR